MGNPMLKPLDPFRFLLIAVAGWMNQHQLQVIDYLGEENRVLREQLGGPTRSPAAVGRWGQSSGGSAWAGC